MKLKILQIKRKNLTKYLDYSKKLIKDNINLSDFEFRNFSRQLKKFSYKSHIFLLSRIGKIDNGILICNFDTNSGVATIIWLIIDRKFQKKKIGSKLVFKIFQILKKKPKIHKIRVFSYTKKSNNFYKKLNFHQEGFHPKHWYKKSYWSFGKIVR